MKQLVNPFGSWWDDQPEEFISFKILREFVGDDADFSDMTLDWDGGMTWTTVIEQGDEVGFRSLRFPNYDPSLNPRYDGTAMSFCVWDESGTDMVDIPAIDPIGYLVACILETDWHCRESFDRDQFDRPIRMDRRYLREISTGHNVWAHRDNPVDYLPLPPTGTKYTNVVTGRDWEVTERASWRDGTIFSKWSVSPLLHPIPDMD